MVPEGPARSGPPRIVFLDDPSMGEAAVRAARGLPGVHRVSTAVQVRRAIRRGTADVVLVAIVGSAPERLGLLAEIARLCPVIALAAPGDRVGIRLALHHGARGCLSDPSTSGRDVVDAVSSVRRGGCRLSATAAEVLMDWVATLSGASAAAPFAAQFLTPRERDIVVLVAAGRTNVEIAAALALTVKTVKNRLNRVYAQLGVRDRHEVIALSLGLRDHQDARRPA